MAMARQVFDSVRVSTREGEDEVAVFTFGLFMPSGTPLHPTWLN